MKRVLKSIFSIIGLLGILSVESCYSPPEFPIAPKITLEEVSFVETPFGQADSLLIKIHFTDGDGDLGLTEKEIVSPYNDKAYFSYNPVTNRLTKFALDTLSINEGNSLFSNIVNYRSRQSAPLDTLPSFVSPYSCTNWELFQYQDTGRIDTLYYERNVYHNNILVEFLRIQPGGGFQIYDFREQWDYPNCGISYDGRFPLMQEPGIDRPLEGTIQYGMTSVGFKDIFSIDQLKLRVQIFDRRLNRSNVIETPPFTLSEITVSRGG